MSFIEGGLGSGAGFVIYDETAADKRGNEKENLENEPEDKENMYVCICCSTLYLSHSTHTLT